MQLYADVTGREFKVTASTQTPALGSAMHAAVAAGSAEGGYDRIEEAAAKMARLKEASYLYIYRHRSEVNGIVHTHSCYATAFAAVGQPIPVYLTAQAAEFGGTIPCGGFALIGGEEIGQVVLEAIGDSPAVLLKNHGVFTIGRSGEAAVKAAVMVEDIARTVWLALQLGTPDVISSELIDKLHYRYIHIYGQ